MRPKQKSTHKNNDLKYKSLQFFNCPKLKARRRENLQTSDLNTGDAARR